LCKELALSTPKVTNLLNDLIEEGLVQDYGKVDSTGGRKPNLYGLVSDSAFFVGVDIKQSHLNLGLSDFQNNIIKISEVPYTLANTRQSLDELCNLINQFIKGLSVSREKILGVGVNLTGRINHATGYSYSFFYFDEEPLSKLIEHQVGIRVFLENDSRAMAYGEFSAGSVDKERNVLFLNLDHGIGMGIMLNSELYYGKSGYAGEFGHIPVFDNEVICHCGKKGCLETEASGWALTRMFKERLKTHTSTLITRQGIKPENIQLEHIIQAAKNDDVLAIDLIAQIGEKLGKGIAVLINLFNPEVIILGGSLAETGDYIRLPMKSAINKFSLSLVSNDTRLVLSKLKEKAGVTGACLLVRDRLLANA
jgi:transcriptional regulator of PTS gene